MVRLRRSPGGCGLVALLVLVALLSLMVVPSSATLVLTGTVFSPQPPLVAASQQDVSCSIAILPSGATTFSRYHTLQMQTDLLNARWNIQVQVNGGAAAQQSASGDTAFVNGYLLSYPTTNDVSLSVGVNGTVPAGSGATVTVLQVTELDNGGAPVPGGNLAVTAPVATPVPVNTTGSAGPGKVAPSSSPSQPARSPGFPADIGLFAAAAGIALCGLSRQRR